MHSVRRGEAYLQVAFRLLLLHHAASAAVVGSSAASRLERVLRQHLLGRAMQQLARFLPHLAICTSHEHFQLQLCQADPALWRQRPTSRRAAEMLWGMPGEEVSEAVSRVIQRLSSSAPQTSDLELYVVTLP
jgi:hypothetical protein